jgi:hypothetical protein
LFAAELVAIITPFCYSCFMNQFENPSAYKNQVIATGLPASPGAAVGQIVFTAEDAEAWHAQGKPAILVHVLSLPFKGKNILSIFMSF